MNKLSQLAHKYEGNTCAEFDRLLEQRQPQVSDAQAWYNAWNSGRVSWNDIPDAYKPAVRQLMAEPA